MPAARIPAHPAPAKLRVPRLGRVVPRERLFALLDASAASPGVWISGPPGAGKTTLVASYLEARGAQVLWLQLDAADTDPAGFIQAVWAAAEASGGPIAARQPPPSPDDLRDVPALLRRMLRRLAQALPAPWVLVLDNVQGLDPASALHIGLAEALAELPTGARLVAIGREPAPPAYARVLAHQQLSCVEAPALRFTAEETTALVALHDGDAAPRALCDATDGWAAAMILMLAQRRAVAPRRSAQADLPCQRVFDLIAAEVLDGMRPGILAALCRIAFLPSASSAMAIRLTGDARAGEWLEDLARRSLFTERRDGPTPRYTFHALFGECLRSRAAAELTPAAMQALYHDAAVVLADNGQHEDAVALLLTAQAWVDALRCDAGAGREPVRRRPDRPVGQLAAGLAGHAARHAGAALLARRARAGHRPAAPPCSTWNGLTRLRPGG